MSKENIEQARMAVFDYFVDTLVDLSDPQEEDREAAVDDMIQIATILFEGLDLKVVEVEGSTVQAQMTILSGI